MERSAYYILEKPWWTYVEGLLTTRHPASSYGLPVFVVTQDPKDVVTGMRQFIPPKGTPLGPADMNGRSITIRHRWGEPLENVYRDAALAKSAGYTVEIFSPQFLL